MKKMSLLILLTISMSIVKAQNISLQCIYLEDYSRSLDNVSKKENDEWCLDIQNNRSAFYSTRERAYRHLKDSMIAKGADLYDIIDASPKTKKSSQALSIYKNIPQANDWTVTDQIITKRFKYIEKIHYPTWKLTQNKKEILGYKCQQAQTTHLGREWTVWFTPDIPIQEGPWKLSGLPGLILDAQDSDGHFHFYCTEIKKTPPHTINIEPYRYISTNRIKFLKEIWECDVHTNYYYQTRLGKKWEAFNPDGSRMNSYNEHPIYLEKINYE